MNPNYLVEFYGVRILVPVCSIIFSGLPDTVPFMPYCRCNMGFWHLAPFRLSCLIAAAFAHHPFDIHHMIRDQVNQVGRRTYRVRPITSRIDPDVLVGNQGRVLW